MKRWYLFFAVALGLATGALSARGNEVYKFDPAHSTIGFQVRQFLGMVKGRFTRFSGTIEVDRDHPEQSSVIATIQVASIDTAIAKRDEHLRSDEFFNVAKFPEITFKRHRVKQTGANTGEIEGDLTMHGVTRPITLHVQLMDDAESLMKNRASRWRVTTTPIRRSQFEVVFSKRAEALSMIADEVAIEIEIAAARAK